MSTLAAQLALAGIESRPRRFSLASHPNLLRLISVGGFVLLWEYFGRDMNPMFMSYPTKIAAAFVTLVQSGELQTQLLISLQTFAYGFAASVLVGILLGLVMGRYRTVALILSPFMNALYSTPRVAFIPLIILWFGLGIQAKTLIVFLSAVFPVVMNTHDGVRNLSGSLVEVAKAYNANERQIVTKVVLPWCVPFIAAGVRIAVGRSVVGMVTAEMFTAVTGMGYMLVVYANTFATDKLFVPTLVLCVMGIVLNEGAMHLERMLARWKETERA